METSLQRKAIIVGTSFFVVCLSAFTLSAFNSPASAEELAREAYELRLKAMKRHCEAIGEKVADCYAGDRAVCQKLQESIAWFSGEYGEYPELACSTDPAPLVFGDGRK